MKSEDANRKTSVRYSFLLLSFFIVGIIGPWNKSQAQTGDIFFETLSPDLGLSQITVSCIFQDSKGLMWFGTQYGLNRFDGYSIDVYETETDNKTSISNSSINGIIEDHKGYLWIATENGLNRYCYETDEFLRFFKAQDEKGISGNKVSSIYRDRKGRIWIGTEQGLDFLNYDSLTFTRRTFNNFLSNNRIFSIHDDSFGNLWIGTLKGLIRYTVESDSWRIFTNNPNASNSLSNNHVRSILEDSNKSVWIGTRDGLNLYDPRNESFLQFGKSICNDKELTHSAVRCMVEDSEKNLLIGTNEGLNVFNLDTKELSKHNQKKRGPGNLNHFFIYSLFIDNARTVWVGTFSGGINFYNSFVRKFRFYNPGNNIVFGSIGPLIEQKNELWIATAGGGLLNYDLNFNFKEQYLLNSIGKTYDQNIVRSLIGDGKFIYAGTNEKLLQLNPDSKRVITKENNFKGYISAFLKDKNECIWLCQNDTLGLHFINNETGKKEQAYYYGENGAKRTIPFATCIKEDSEGIFWVGTRYAGLFLYDSKKKKAQRFTTRSDSASLQTNHITALHIDSHDNLWIGTFDGGLSLLNRHTNKFTTFSQASGLLNTNIFGILEDNAGFLWIETLLGISKFDPAKTVFVNYYKENGLPLQEMSENSFVKLKDGRFFAGGNNGFVVFDPLKIKTNNLIPPVLISDFKLLGSKVSDKGAVKRKFISSNEKIKLKYNQSSFIVEYTALNYIFPGKNQYAYKLEGFDKDWNFVGKQRIAIYTNLNAGNYIFRVKACNNDGIWNEKGMSLPIRILPPPWKTWWAYLIYFIILTGFFFRLIHYLKLENEVKIQQIEHDNMEKVHHLRIRLFTNFSHELRTPLTLILGPLDDLLDRSDVSTPVRNSLVMVQKNARRLLILVNQLMDFRKQESGSMKLKTVERKVNKFVREVSMAFNELAVRQRINYILDGCDEDILLWFDPAQLEKVLFNLLSNAFKNTAPDGKMVISLIRRQLKEMKDLPESKRMLLNSSKAEEFVELSIRNTGKGIQQNELNKIFDPFYQIADDGHSSIGTGIGLSLVKGIVELHHGVVWAENYSEGVIFRMFFPSGKQHLAQDEINRNYLGSEHVNHYLVSDDSDENIIPESDGDAEKKCTILVIDDNADIRQYIKSKLKNEFNILEAANGREGQEIAIRHIPDLIISDIMMPDIDGLQLCIKLKNDIHTSHIPIILLTARTTFEQVKEGFDVGADDYITKPFNANILRVKVNSVINNRERLRQTYGKKLPFELTGLETKSLDAEFLKKIYRIIEKNLSNPEFDIESFSEEVGMSRANLYRKIKNLTSLAPNELIRNYRLQVGLKYLRETDLSISEISYKTGFNNPAYFTNCFKKVHRLSPTEYLEKIKG